MKAHLAGLARVLANANEISLGWVFPGVWGFSRLNICVYVNDLLLTFYVCLWIYSLLFLLCITLTIGIRAHGSDFGFRWKGFVLA